MARCGNPRISRALIRATKLFFLQTTGRKTEEGRQMPNRRCATRAKNRARSTASDTRFPVFTPVVYRAAAAHAARGSCRGQPCRLAVLEFRERAREHVAVDHPRKTRGLGRRDVAGSDRRDDRGHGRGGAAARLDRRQLAGDRGASPPGANRSMHMRMAAISPPFAISIALRAIASPSPSSRPSMRTVALLRDPNGRPAGLPLWPF